MKDKLETVVNNMTGDYTADLNKISDAIERAMEEGDQKLVMALIEYGRSRMERHSEDSSSEIEKGDYRSRDYDWGLNKKTMPQFYEQFNKAVDLIQKNEIKKSMDALATAKKWLIPEEELRTNVNLRSFQSIFDEAIYKKLLWKEQDQVVVPEEQMFYALYGQLLYELGDLESAKKALDISARLNPIESMSQLLLSDIEKINGNETDARDFNLKALKYAYIAEDMSVALLNEGNYVLESKMPELAYRFFELALAYDPSNPDVHRSIEHLYTDYPDVSPASDTIFEDYIEKESIDLPPRREIIDILEHLVKYFESEENWELAATACSFLEALPIDNSDDYHHKLHYLMSRMESNTKE